MAQTAGLASYNRNATTGSYAFMDLRASSADFRLAAINRGRNIGEFVLLLDNGGARQVMRIFANGNYNIGTATTDGGGLFNIIGKSDIIQQKIIGHSSQTANLTEWQTSAGANLLVVGSTGYLQFAEQAAPPAPAANYGLLFTRDDGAGVTELCARFATGDIFPIAVQGITFQTYTPSNVTPDRSFDADATTLDELADIVGTLVQDLQAQRILL